MGKLFGTDGIRGIVGEDLTEDLAFKTAVAATKVLVSHLHKKPKIIIGRDTRESGEMLANAMARGFCSVGADVVIIGVAPTPAVAYLVREMEADAGVMISASHNAAIYNGIKIFSGNGFKLPDSIEDEIEDIIFNNEISDNGIADGNIIVDNNAVETYIDYIVSCADTDLKGMKVTLDCANGTASATAKKIFDKLGAETIIYHDEPDGQNINKNCGSTHIEKAEKHVVENCADIGFSFDGDADRCLAVDESGNKIDGDKIIAFLALYLKERGELKGDSVVATVLSNMGFIKMLKTYNINTLCAKVGDRYVLEEMQKNNYSLGGEQSGHIIMLDKATTGDGQLTAVMILCALKHFNDRASFIFNLFIPYPQVQINIAAQNHQKEFLLRDEEFSQAVKKAEKILNDNGRVLIRPSGTEPKFRIMVEGDNLQRVEEIANELANLADKRLAQMQD